MVTRGWLNAEDGPPAEPGLYMIVKQFYQGSPCPGVSGYWGVSRHLALWPDDSMLFERPHETIQRRYPKTIYVKVDEPIECLGWGSSAEKVSLDPFGDHNLQLANPPGEMPR